MTSLGETAPAGLGRVRWRRFTIILAPAIVLIATLLMRGVFVTVNQSLDGELVKDVARQFGADATILSFEDQMANEALENILQGDNLSEAEVPRSPVPA